MRFFASWALRCLRWSYFRYFIPAKLDAQFVERGKRAEELAEKRLSYFRLRRGKNRELHFRNYVVAGRPDFVTRDAIIEVKSSIPRQFFIPYLAQLNLYMLMEGKRIGILVLVNERDELIKTIYVGFSRFIVKQCIAYFDALYEHIKKSVIPEGVIDSKICSSCSFSHQCGNGLEEFRKVRRSQRHQKAIKIK